MPHPTDNPIAGWHELIDSLRELPAQLLAKLPEARRADPQIQQEVARLALEALTSAAIDAIGGDGDCPVFLPAIGQLLNVGQPNADTIYRSARITPGGSYRLRGERGTTAMVRIGQVVPRHLEGTGRSYLDVNQLTVDDQGRFDLLLSPNRPDDYLGDWWELSPHANKLMLRIVSCDWANERSPTLAIERVDQPAGRPRRSAADLEQRLRTLPVGIGFLAGMFVDHVQQLRDQGFTNRLKAMDVPASGGLLTGQFYYEGAYDIGDDEALIIEAKVPDVCPYFSLILTNEIYETLDWTNNHSSLNNAQAQVTGDGMLRVVIASRDPGVLNWLDTAGHPQGLVQGRWTDCDSQPVPTVRKVPLAAVRAHLPADTTLVSPDQRDWLIRERRAAYQQRPHW